MTKLTITNNKTGKKKVITGYKANAIALAVVGSGIAITTVFGNAVCGLGKNIVKSFK